MSEEKTGEIRLGTGSVGKLMLRFAVPGVTAMLVNALYNIVDQIFIGRSVGYLGNGAANVVLLVSMVTLALALLIGDGAAAGFNLSLGAGRREEARKTAGTAVVMIGVGSLMVMAICLMFFQPILRLFGCTEALLPLASEYGILTVLGLPFLMISTSVNALIRADGSPRYAMVSMILGAVINGCLDPVFLFGLDWGIKGAAMASVIGQGVSFLLSIAYLKRFQSVTFTREAFRFRGDAARRICGLGISSFIDQAAFTLVMAVNNNLIVFYGARSGFGSEIPLTAYGVSMKVQEILFTILLGIAMGMQPIVSYNYGAQNYPRVKKAYWMAVRVGTVVSVGAVILFVCFPEPIIRLFGSQEQELYMEFSKDFFRTYFLLYAFFGFQNITGVFFQAIGKPGRAALISLSYQLVFKIVSAVGLSAAMGLSGVLWSGPAADGMAFVLTSVLLILELRRIGTCMNRDAESAARAVRERLT